MTPKVPPLVVVCIFCLVAVLGLAQSPDRTAEGVVEAKLLDGSTVKGVGAARSPNEITLQTEIGTLRIPTTKLTAESKQRLLTVQTSPVDQGATIAKLQARIAALEAENQDLRKRLVGALQTPSPSSLSLNSGLTPSPPSTVARTTPSDASGGLTYTISSTGKRHNSRCRYYKVGTQCGPNQGVACKICGG